MGLLDKVKNLLSPEVKVRSEFVPMGATGRLSRQDVVDSVVNQFLQELASESTKRSMLFHTSYVIYLREDDYKRISQGFEVTVNEMVDTFLEIIGSKLSKYPNYKPHSNYWTFQLACIPEGGVIEGVDEDEMGEKMLVIMSSIYPENDYNSDGGGNGGRVVTTMHTVNSMKAMPKAMNMDLLLGLDMLSRDMYRVKFDRQNVLHLAGGVHSMPAVPVTAYATLSADDGRFVEAGRPFTRYEIIADEVRIVGRNAVDNRTGALLHVDSDEVMNPHVIIRRDGDSGAFFVTAVGPTRLNERSLARGMSEWVPLPNNSTILLNDEVQLTFKIK